MEPFGAFFGTKCTPYLEARLKARSATCFSLESTFERESIVQCYRWGSISENVENASPFFPRNEDLIVVLMSSKKREQHRKVDQL